MTTLARERCVACRRDAPRVTDEEIAQLHPEVADWELNEIDGVKHLQRTFKIKGFAGAMQFATIVGNEAEKEGHHPRITFEWGRVMVDWWTHKIRGLHRNDFVMAAKTNDLFEEYAATNAD